MLRNKITGLLVIATVASILSTSCGRDANDPGLEYASEMYKSEPANPDQPNTVFADGKTAQKPIAGTIPTHWAPFNYPNNLEGYLAASAELSNPLDRREEILTEGKKLYISMCSPCHGVQGKGDGTIVVDGKYPAPPSYSTGVSSRGGDMKDLTPGKIYHTITYGLNLMGPHASQLTPEERWKVVHYVQELQKLQ